MEARLKQLEDALSDSVTRLAAQEQRAAAAEQELTRLREAQVAQAQAAAAATPRPGAGSASTADREPSSATLVDTKLLSKPKPFTGRDDEWAAWSFKWKAHLGAMNPKLLSAVETA